MLTQIFQPFSYLVIRHPYKWQIDWLFPVVTALVCAYFSLSDDWSTNIYRVSGPVSLLLGFFQCLPGFYIAALAAIATFGRTDIDNVLPEPTPTYKISKMGESVPIKLTRRRFLAMLFSFLTCESIALVLFSVFYLTCGSEIAGFMFQDYSVGEAITVLLAFFYYVLMVQLLTATFWGLYYLGFKLHEPQ
jgi:hypothetical protein